MFPLPTLGSHKVSFDESHLISCASKLLLSSNEISEHVAGAFKSPQAPRIELRHTQVSARSTYPFTLLEPYETHLFELPPEILELIFAHLGSSWLREDFARLTISRAWYVFAIKAFYQAFTFSHRSICCLLARPSFASDLSNIYRTTERITLNLNGLDFWEPPEAAPWCPSNGQVGQRWGPKAFSRLAGICDQWFEESQKMHITFSQVLQMSPRARYLCILAGQKYYPDKKTYSPYFFANQITRQAIKTLCRIKSLTSLTLDLHGLSFWGHKPDHLCVAVVELLTSLHSLKLRLPEICHKILTVAEGYQGKLKLRDVVINLSCSPRSDIEYKMSSPCWKGGWRTCLEDENLSSMCAQGRVLQAQMAKSGRLSILKCRAARPSLDPSIVDDWMDVPLYRDFGPDYEDLMQIYNTADGWSCQAA